MTTRKNDNNIVLNGRIYPAIQKCMDNRYKIIIGLFGYYAFYSNYSEKINYEINLGVHVIFSLFIFQNLFNYILNSNEQSQLEKKLNLEKANDKKSWFLDLIKIIIKKFPNFFEWTFSIIILTFIWIKFLFID